MTELEHNNSDIQEDNNDLNRSREQETTITNSATTSIESRLLEPQQNNSPQNENGEEVKTHTRKRSLDYTPFDPDSIKTEKQKKRIPGKLMDKFWQPLDDITESALDKIIDISISKARDRYKGLSKSSTTSPKMVEANELLIHTWKLDDPRSFKSRLKHTKLPLKRSMHTTSSQNDENKFILNYDVLKWRKGFLETHLLAELKQLDELKKTYNKTYLNYQADLKYLAELKQSIKTNKEKMNQTLTDKKQEMKLEVENSTDKIGVITTNNTQFKPQDDDDVNELLSKISTDLEKITKHSKYLLDFNDKLQNFQADLELL